MISWLTIQCLCYSYPQVQQSFPLFLQDCSFDHPNSVILLDKLYLQMHRWSRGMPAVLSELQDLIHEDGKACFLSKTGLFSLGLMCRRTRALLLLLWKCIYAVHVLTVSLYDPSPFLHRASLRNVNADLPVCFL